MFDPERAHGLAAVAISWERESSVGQTLTRYRIVDGKVEATRERNFSGNLLRSDPDGTLAIADSEGNGRVRLVRDGETVRTVHFGFQSFPALARDYSRFATRDRDGGITMYDDTGTQLWRTTVWMGNEVMFSPSASRVFVTSMGGIVALDAKTGSQVARACGFEFGVHDKLSELMSSNQGSVCEDSLIE
jgi:hypothetical protein